jgi:fructose-1,6-bisphosphatase/inositol monophosphatase family enzyme
VIKIDFNNVRQAIEDVAEEHILPYFGALKTEDVSFKIGDDPVTIADQKAESALSARLLDLLPGSNVVGEEAFAANPGILNRFYDELPVWIIDPIDGTRNFVKGDTRFGVIVALTKQNQTIAGWIYDPTSKEMVEVELGSGAFYKGHRLKTAPAAPFPDMFGYLGDRLVDTLSRCPDAAVQAPNYTMMSAGAHEYPSLVIQQPHFGGDKPFAHFRASFFHCTPWDDAAGVLMHREAGGYSAFWSGDTYQPSMMHTGLALAPDQDSWNKLREWCLTFADLPQ